MLWNQTSSLSKQNQKEVASKPKKKGGGGYAMLIDSLFLLYRNGAATCQLKAKQTKKKVNNLIFEYQEILRRDLEN